MTMEQLDLGIYEVLTSVGAKPEDARKAERQLEAAIHAGHEFAKADLMTKADGLRLEASLKAEMASLRTEMASLRTEMRSLLSEQLRWTIALMFTFTGVIIAVIKL
jgi:hypothetical protein